MAYIGVSAEVNTHQTQDLLVNGAKISFDRRTRLGIAAMDRQINGDVEHFGAFREIHSKKKNVAPTAMGEIHAYGGALAQNRIRAVGAGFEQLRAEPQGLIGRMTHAEHPLVAT